MSSGWFCKEVESIEDAAEDGMVFVEGGETVAFQDDIGYFAEQMKISVDDIKMAD
jgi:hypothetical protein